MKEREICGGAKDKIKKSIDRIVEAKRREKFKIEKGFGFFFNFNFNFDFDLLQLSREYLNEKDTSTKGVSLYHFKTLSESHHLSFSPQVN